MYLALVAFLVATAVGVGCSYAGSGWFGSIFFGFIAFAVTWVLGVRRLGKKMAPMMEQAQRQMAGGAVQPAIATLRSMLPYGNWVPLLKGQLYAQLGFLLHHAGDRDAAIEHLTKAGRRAGDARVMLASLQYQAGKKAEALKLLADSRPFNRKHALLHNLYAWLLERDGKRDQAISVLNELLLKSKDEATEQNKLRLQNNQRMSMGSFGAMWYMLGLERPPASMGAMRTAPKGFRQQSKRRG